MSANLERVATFTRELAEISAREIAVAFKIPANDAADLGLRIATQVCTEYAGELIYIPTGFAVRIDQRDQDMYAAWRASGKNIVTTAKQFGVTVKTAYQRIRLVEAADYARRQSELFPDP